MESLPTIAASKHSLVEASKELTKSAQSFAGGDSGLDLRGTCSNPASRVSSARSPPGGFLRSSHTTPLSPRLHTPSKGTAEYVRISKAEHDRKEQLLTTLRNDCQQLQAKVRNLENQKESHSMLFSACTKAIAMLGCPTEGVTVESLKEILCTRVSGLSQELHHTEQQLLTCRTQLEATRTELAAANVKITSLESQCQQNKVIQSENERQLQHLSSELGKVHESNARTTASLESVREQMKEMERRRQQPDTGTITELQLEMGRLKCDLRAKEEIVQDLVQRIQDRENEQAITCDRASSAEGMYAELCVQMAAALDLDASDSYDTGYLVSRVSSVLHENDELKAKTNTLSMSVRGVELDSTANKETISRLEYELKRAEQEAERLRALQETSHHVQSSLKSTIDALGKEKESLHERLAISKETIVAQQQEMKLKEANVSHLQTQVHSLSTQCESESENVVCLQNKLDEFVESIGSLLGTSSCDTKQLLQCIKALIEKICYKEKAMTTLEQEHKQLQSKHTEACSRLAGLHKELEEEGERRVRAEAEAASLHVVNKGLRQDVERHQPFVAKLAKALQLDTGAAEILSGEFAEEAVLSKISQLANHETQALVERQCSVYSLQRKLKASRQALESKELHNGLLQKKIVSLEGRLISIQRNEVEWEKTIEKAAKTEKQLEHLHTKLAQQSEAISHLKTQKTELEKMRMMCDEQKQVIIQLKESVDDLNQKKLKQAQQLAEVRQKTETTIVREQDKVGGLEGEVKALNKEIGQLKERERELAIFRSTVRKLLVSVGGENQTDYDIIAKLESLVAKYKKQVETSRQLEDSLKQLESGFRSGYNNTMTVLSSD
ncbi:hypothetical protein EMCRGX_G032460 [Ephydatia muelleri]